MNFFKKNSSGYTLLELMITISISTFLLILGFVIYQKQHKKVLSNEHYRSSPKDGLTFFAKTTLFISTSTRFVQKDAKTLALELEQNGYAEFE